MENLVTAPIISISSGTRHSLPGLLAAMARDEVRGFPAQRPHQRAAWHMFLVQLAALALWTAGRDDLPQAEDDWRALLMALTGGDTGPWALTGPEDKPAFLQPPAPKGLNWNPVDTPDALDLLITSRNHDLKQRIARHAEPQDWVFALVSLQTQKIYDVQYHGIVRARSAAACRPMLSLAPTRNSLRSASPDPSAMWRRDVGVVCNHRRTEYAEYDLIEKPALLWVEPWPLGAQYKIWELDPLFIEASTRVRLYFADGHLIAKKAPSKPSHISREEIGTLFDPWGPKQVSDFRPFNLGGRDFTYKVICEIIYSEKWYAPILAQPQADEDGDFLLIAESISVPDQSKTDGWKSRVIPVPGANRGWLQSETAGTFADKQINEIKVFDEALRNALALVAARGEYDGIGKAQYARTTDARARFDRAADALFFPALWDRLAAFTADGKTGEEAAHERFLASLLAAAKLELAAAMPAIPCAAVHRPRAEARAKRAFAARLRKDGFMPAPVVADEKEHADV